MSEQNGTALLVEGGPTGLPEERSAPRIPKRSAWVDVEPEEYSGFQVRLWLNPPAGTAAPIFSTESDEDTQMAALGQIVLEHNGWLDFDGEPYPPSTDAAFWKAIPTELAALILVQIVNVINDRPNFARAQLRT